MAITNDPTMAGAREHIVAMFETYERARDARNALRTMGLAEADMHILDRNAAEDDSTLRYERNDTGFWGALKRLFVPETEAPAYTEGLRRGHAMLVVEPPAGREREIITQLETFDPLDLEEREREWRAAGWTGAGMAGHGELGRSGRDRPALEPGVAATGMAETAATAGPGSPAALRAAETGRVAGTPPVAGDIVPPVAGETAPVAGRVPAGKEGAIPIVEERLDVGKRMVDRGSVRVRSYVVERPVEETVNLREERVNVERRPVERAAGAVPDDAFREREIEVDAKGEEPVVRKEARVVEEVVVTKDEDTRTETVRDNVRRTDVEVDDSRTGRTPAVKTPPRRP